MSVSTPRRFQEESYTATTTITDTKATSVAAGALIGISRASHRVDVVDTNSIPTTSVYFSDPVGSSHTFSSG